MMEDPMDDDMMSLGLDPSESEVVDKICSVILSKSAMSNFLRCVHLFNQKFIRPIELSRLVKQLFSDDPKFVKRFHSILDLDALNSNEKSIYGRRYSQTDAPQPKEVKLDYRECVKVGVSYRRMSLNVTKPKCSGRTPLCDSVLNDSHFSCPDWSKPRIHDKLSCLDRSPVMRKERRAMEALARIEDERFEMDMLIEPNLDMIIAYEKLRQAMENMSPNKLARFKLTNTLGGSSKVIFRRVLERFYGSRSSQIVCGLKAFPAKAVICVLRRLKAKTSDWRAVRNSKTMQWDNTVCDAYEALEIDIPSPPSTSIDLERSTTT